MPVDLQAVDRSGSRLDAEAGPHLLDGGVLAFGEIEGFGERIQVGATELVNQHLGGNVRDRLPAVDEDARRHGGNDNAKELDLAIAAGERNPERILRIRSVDPWDAGVGRRKGGTGHANEHCSGVDSALRDGVHGSSGRFRRIRGRRAGSKPRAGF